MTPKSTVTTPPASSAPGQRKSLELSRLRDDLASRTGRAYWRSLEEAAQTPEFEAMVHREFPQLASEWTGDGVSRRKFLQLMSASVAFGGLVACTRQPLEKIVPYVVQPEEIVPGRPLYFATGMERDGFALGLLAESHMGRPTKIEGNPQHPASLGATDLFAQASVLDLYDPDRSQTVKELGRIRTWGAFRDAIGRGMQPAGAPEPTRLRLLTGPLTSPTEARLIASILAEHPTAAWHQYAPAASHHRLTADAAAFGRALSTRYDFTRADVVLSLDADFLTQGPGAVRYARDFMSRRRPRLGTADINRLYALETTPSATGTVADHRVPVSTAELGAFTAALAAELDATSRGTGRWTELAAIVARDLESRRGRCLVVAGEQTSVEVQVLAHWLNEQLGNVGGTVTYHEPVEARPEDGVASLRQLAAAMQAGEVDLLVILGTNPVYDAPADLDFAGALRKVAQSVQLSLHEDETTELCRWHVPAAHYLEAWGDHRAYDGTVTLTQPLIEPLYGGKTASEVLALFTPDGEQPADALLRATWSPRLAPGFERAWRRCLHDGLVPDTAAAAVEVSASATAAAAARDALERRQPPEVEICFRPDPTIFDGRFANNGWLQECPKPLSKLTWDNPLLVSPALAERLGLANGQVVEMTVGDRSLEAPVWVHPGQPEASVTLTLGYGRRRCGRVAAGTGFDAGRLRTSRGMWSAPVSLAARDREVVLASTQMHSNIEASAYQGANLEGRTAAERHLVRQATVAEFERRPDFPHHLGHGVDEELSLMPGYDYSQGYAWGLSVDLNTCMGCNACVIACQSENNIPIVGKDEVFKGREMHWIRIDRYYEGELDDPELHNQPVMCMHCEQAPCEVVCPVAATTHSNEGLNDMVYNRCVGTRYCANNCPYKVRRFNFFKYADTETPVTKLMRNPDVTVRSRGVMEKCSYCVQRINQARIVARKEDRAIRDGEIRTACQQVCPTEAIVFGDLNDATSRVAALKAEPHDYGILTELGTRPRTTYLAKVRNPNPQWPAAAAHEGGHGG
jgi:MoCo/4Fe-4S cofactor protein with predicted Tat translocation signal